MTIYTVNTNSDVTAADANLTLREAIDLANLNPGADTIEFAAGVDGQTITLTQGELEITDAVTIDGDIDNDKTPDIIVDAGGNSRVINITVASAATTLQGLILTGGYTSGDNEPGGGVYSGASLTIIDSRVSGNATGGNHSNGGGVFSRGDVIVTNSTISSNSTFGATSEGGGIRSNVTITLTDSTVDGNISYGSHAKGGGIFAAGAIDLTNSTVSRNSTNGDYAYGGGISGNSTITLSNSTVSGNTTVGVYAKGGGIYGSDVTLSNSTVSGNSTTGTKAYAGGIWGFGGTITLTNSIVLGNAATNASGDQIEGSAATLVGGNIIGRDNTAGADIFNGAADTGVDTTAAAVFAATVNNNGVDAGVLADNGGPVRTIALNADAANPALDASDASGTAQDARGEDAFNRPGIGAETGAGIRDLGAFEAGEAPSLVVTIATDVVDEFDEETSLREAIAFANSKAGADVITFDAGLSGQTITLGGTEIEITDAVTIDGDIDDDGAADITVDANDQSRVINITDAGAATTLLGLVLTGGKTTGADENGGAVYSAAALTLADSAVTDSATTGLSSTGGGIYGKTTVTLTGSTVSGNSTALSGSHGGGIASLGAVMLTDSTVSGNSVGTVSGTVNGGGIWGQSTVTLTNSTVSGNSTAGTNSSAGGIFGLGAVTLTNSTVSGNSTTGNGADGGGVYNLNTGVTLINSTITGNSTAGTTAEGGGILSYAAVNLTNSIVLGNVTANSTDDEIKSTTLNRTGGNIIGRDGSNEADVFDGNTDVGDTLAGYVFLWSSARYGIHFGVLADNGGPVQTVALAPSTGNPALDVGGLPAGVTTDARGEVRNFDFPGTGNDGMGFVDLGAFELQLAEAETKSLVVTISTDTVNALDNETSLREAVAFANTQAGADVITFDASLSGDTITLSGTELEITDDVTIDGDIDNDGTPDITVDANEQSRVFNISNTGAITTLQGLTLTGGRTTGLNEDGGAIFSFADLTVEDSVVTGNSTTGDLSNGGGIAARGTLTLNTSTVSNNSTAGNRGDGGGIYGFGAITLTNSTVSGNSTAGNYGDGGGISGRGTVTLTGSTVSNNSTTTGPSSGGGGISSSGAITLTDSTVSGNSSAGNGGGIYGNFNVTLTNSTVSGNSTTEFSSDGGGIFGNNVTLTNSTVSGNSTAGSFAEGGGISGSGAVTLTNSIVLGNVTTFVGVADDEVRAGGGLTLTGGNIIGRDGAAGADVFNGALDVGDTTAAAVFAATVGNNGVTAGVLASNGGLVQTIALKRDASNAALDASNENGTATDARGETAFDVTAVGANSGAGIRDLGAFELTTDVAIARNDAFTISQDAKASGNVRSDNGSGADSAPTDLTVTKVNGAAASVGSTITLPSGARLIVNANGTFSYDPGDAFDGLGPGQSDTDTFTYEITDVGGATATATATVNINGTNDTIVGAAGNDNLNGFDTGTNLILGLDGDDRLSGGKNADTLKGAGGNDTLLGQGGTDSLEGSSGRDKAEGGSGSDTMKGGGGNDRLKGQSGGDKADGGGGDDIIKGGGGKDTLAGGRGKDTIDGAAGTDTLEGGGGNDNLDGGARKDKIEGGAGKDKQTGGGGNDSFIYKKPSDSKPGKKADKITDFNGSGDKINLKKIDAKTGGGNQAFDFIGDAPFSGTNGELRYDKLKGKTLIQADRDGDGKADFEILLTDAMNLQGSDFIL